MFSLGVCGYNYMPAQEKLQISLICVDSDPSLSLTLPLSGFV